MFCVNNGQNGDLFCGIRGGVSGMDKSYPSKAKGTACTVPFAMLVEHAQCKTNSYKKIPFLIFIIFDSFSA